MDWKPLSEFIRSLVRPVVTVSLVLAAIFFVAAATTMPAEFWEALKLAMIFWFVERGMKNSK